ncbi:MAG: TetR/AcrR family transcriptional regulator [Deltaproteobacteria bacterium]|jgi:AcrR family transcriptional regulator|nr:TetR/AcrR family transcriptional regulator [Deltaproteobacteria bacterium]
MTPETLPAGNGVAPESRLARLKSSAIRLFSERGYEGAHISEIARVAGVRKSSVYTHCSSKDDLFLSLVRESAELELETVRDRLDEGGILTGLRSYLEELPARMKEDPPVLSFLLRSLYTPPPELKAVVLQVCERLFGRAKSLFAMCLADGGVPPDGIRGAVEACNAVMDSLHVACMYCPQNVQIRLESSWSMLESYINSF